MTDDHIATLTRLAMILEAGQAENGIDLDRQTTYAEAVRAALESRVLTDDASETYREVGVWDTDGRKFRTYAAENLNGKAMYVRDAAMQADKERQ